MKAITPFLVAAFVAGGPAAWSQCTPNPANTALISPDTVTNFVSGIVGQPYSQVVYLHPPDDTTTNVPPFGNVTVNLTDITLNSVDNLPPGLAYACNPGTCIYPGGVSGCALISGTPSVAGTYVLEIAITANGTTVLLGQTIAVTQDDTIRSYRIVIDPPATGIAGTGNAWPDDILSVHVRPGGFEADVRIATGQDAVLSVTDGLGKTLYRSRHILAPGSQSVMLSVPPPAPGIYVFSVGTASGLLSRKFAVTGSR